MDEKHSIQRGFPSLQRLVEIETKASLLFLEAGYDSSRWPVNSVTTFQSYAEKRQLFVCVNRKQMALGFALVDRYQNNAHLEEIDVDPAFQQQGVAKRLMEAVLSWSKENQLAGMTLRTFKTTPWSVGLYKRFGFEIVSDAKFPYLRKLIEKEAKIPLPLKDRISMFKQVL